MKRTTKTLLSLVMVLAMAMTLLPLAAFAVTDIPTIRLSTSKPIVGDSDYGTLTVNEYGYGIYESLWYTIGIAGIDTKWQYTDEYGDHLMAAGDPYQPETVYTAIVTLTARYDWKFADSPEIIYNGAPANIVAWDSANPDTVTVSYTFPATDPLYEVSEARMTFDEPLYGDQPDFTPDIDYGASFTVLNVYWMDSLGNYLTGSDTFKTGDYTLYVTIEPIATCKFAEPDAMEGSFGEIAWHEYIKTDVDLASDPNNRVLSYTWSVPDPIDKAFLTFPQQAYGETPAMTASPDYWDQSKGYYVKDVKWIDETSAELASDAILTDTHSYSVVMEVYPARGNIFAGLTTFYINDEANAISVVKNPDHSITVTAPVKLKAPVMLDTVEIKLDPGVAIGNEKSWGEVAADADYTFDSITWYDIDDNELYDFHYKIDHIYKAKIQIDAGLGFVFDESANMKVLIDGENADQIDVAGDHRSLIASKTYKVEAPWVPVIGSEEEFDFTDSSSYGRIKEDFYFFAASMDALNAAGKISQTMDIDTLSYDLDKDGTIDVVLQPSSDPAYANIVLAETNSVVGPLTLTLDATEMDYLKEKKPAGYVETIKFLFPTPVEKYTVTFDADGGTGTMDAVTVNKGDKLTLPECAFTAPEGKEFDKWDSGTPGDEIEITADKTVKAVWKDKADDKKTNPFTDVAESDYFYDAVIWAYYAEPQVTNGIGNNLFAPGSTVKRCEAATFLWRAVGCPEPETADNPFEDVKETDYFYKPVLWAVEKGITKGTDDTHFTPDQTCSTAHILTFLYRTMGIGDDGWYQVAEAWAMGAGLLKDLDITVAPGEDCPRRDVVLFLYRAVGSK